MAVRADPPQFVLPLLSLVLHGLALLVLDSEGTLRQIPGDGATRVPLVVLSFLLSAVLAISNDRVARATPFLLMIRYLLLQLLIIPLWYPSLAKEVLITIFLVDLAIYLPPRFGLVAGLVSVAHILWTQGPRKIWSMTVPGAGPMEMAELAITGLVITLLAHGIRHARSSTAEARRESQRLQESSQQIIMANIGFQELAQEIEQQSSEMERLRISREVHDVVGYTLTNQYMALEAAQVILDQPAQRERLVELLATAQAQAKNGINDIRAAMHQLRESPDHPRDVVRGLQNICETFTMATSVKVRFDCTLETMHIPGSLEKVLYRIVQAALTNSFLHGKATEIQVILQGIAGPGTTISREVGPEAISLSIGDNGWGSAEVSEGIGLAGMRERIVPFRGTLAYANTDQGFFVKAIIPLDRQVHP